MTVTATRTIAETAMASDRFSTLCKALQAAHMVDALKEKGPLTVFAPTNEAFKKIPKAKLDALLDDPETLRSILKHHVVQGKVMSNQLSKSDEIESLNQTMIQVNSSRGKLQEADVVESDIECSNGVIHAIDSVLIPSEEMAGQSQSSQGQQSSQSQRSSQGGGSSKSGQ